jgi:hypothetical protein
MVMAVVRMRQGSLPCARVWFGKMSKKLSTNRMISTCHLAALKISSKLHCPVQGLVWKNVIKINSQIE